MGCKRRWVAKDLCDCKRLKCPVARVAAMATLEAIILSNIATTERETKGEMTSTAE